MCTHLRQVCIEWSVGAFTICVGLGDFRVCGEFGVGMPGVWVCAHPEQACIVWFISASACYIGLGGFRVCGGVGVKMPEVKKNKNAHI